MCAGGLKAMLQWLNPRPVPMIVPLTSPREDEITEASGLLEEAKTEAAHEAMKAIAAGGALQSANSKVQSVLREMMSEATGTKGMFEL